VSENVEWRHYAGTHGWWSKAQMPRSDTYTADQMATLKLYQEQAERKSKEKKNKKKGRR
jgi:hypothetical protein